MVTKYNFTINQYHIYLFILFMNIFTNTEYYINQLLYEVYKLEFTSYLIFINSIGLYKFINTIEFELDLSVYINYSNKQIEKRDNNNYLSSEYKDYIIFDDVD